ncbi:GIY-YIG nuclease family protein [Dyadobacter jejuensis]|uniref:GIY-YIG nuclease family protein n=1 Tax=Dyadobacter jejuensis TaxID=1082580 RepID=UPI000D6D0D0C|nr:GIY-YIG nuclease family protein [Dyadobacter jejuensis]
MSEKDGLLYTGYTKNIVNRLNEHNNGQMHSTKSRVPLRLIYWEGCLNQQDATRREKYLKSGNGEIYLKNRLGNFWKNPTG